METIVNGLPLHYVEHGIGTPVLALHGAGVDHREIRSALEPLFIERSGYRRIYADLPAMGRTPAPDTVNNSDDVLDIVLGAIGSIIGDEEFLVVGHSYGAYIARAIANRRPDKVIGLATICSMGAPGQGADGEVPEHVVLHASGVLDGVLSAADEAEFRSYLVVQTAETLRRFQDSVVPAIPLADQEDLGRILEHWELRQAPESALAYTNPTLILAGRQDSTFGYAAQWRLAERYPRATFAVLDRAGHALPHEQVELLHALLAEWLDRVHEHRSRDQH